METEATKKIKPRHHSNLSNKKIMAVLCGNTGAGKTYLMMKILTEPGFLDYNNLIIYTTTSDQAIYQFLKHGFSENLSKLTIRKLYKLYEESEYEENIEEMCKEAAKSKELLAPVKERITAQVTNDMGELSNPSKLPKDKKNCVIFDDCVNEKDQTIQKTYFTRARHHNCACFYLTQSFFGLDGTYIRKNANIFVLFELNKRNLTEVLKDLTVGDNESFKQECRNAWSKDYGYIVVNLDKKNLRDRVITDFFSEENDQ